MNRYKKACDGLDMHGQARKERGQVIKQISFFNSVLQKCEL